MSSLQSRPPMLFKSIKKPMKPQTQHLLILPPTLSLSKHLAVMKRPLLNPPFCLSSPPLTMTNFCDALNNLKALVKEVIGGDASGSAPMRGFLMAGVNGAPVLRFCHVVFEEVNEESGEDGSEMASDSDVAHPAAAEAKLTMQGKYRSNPLPTYNTKGEIIAPERCKTALPGAIVRISFTLTHWHITGSKSDSSSGSAYNIFNADVKSIRVLSDPPAQALTPKKRRTARYDPDDGSPRKKIC
ncbi:hypothetical protein BJ165DRAFT_1404880 [Panaeolus papilionaceus]|nr:hypothetical protein BJ165DRAFT_1404880 [Panaeolus papilionaceus]